MKALIRNVENFLRIENPPFRDAAIFEEDQVSKIRFTIRFAFNAVIAANDGNPTVKLRLLRAQSSPSKSLAASKYFSLKTIGERAKFYSEMDGSDVIYKQDFNILRSLPDDKLSSLKNGLPINYEYTTSVQVVSDSLETESEDPLATRKYLIGLLEKGIDPAAISENFPVIDATRGIEDKHTASRESNYTRQVEKKSSQTLSSVNSEFALFEQEVVMDLDKFSKATVYEFLYAGFRERRPTRSRVLINVDASSIIAKIRGYTETTQTKSFEKRIDSVYAIVPDAFTEARLSVPKISRVVKLLDSGEYSTNFTGLISGRPSSSNGRSKFTARQEPDIFPFYIQENAGVVEAKIDRLPPETIRVDVLARVLSAGQGRYSIVGSLSTGFSSSVSIPLNLSANDTKYEIRIAACDIHSRVTQSSNSIIYDSKRTFSGATLSVTSPESAGQKRKKVFVSATLTSSGRQDLVNIIEQLNSAGISSDIIASIKNDPTSYSQIFSFRAEIITLSDGKQTFSQEFSPGNAAAAVEYSFNSTDPVGTVLTISLGMKSPDALVPAQSRYRFGKFAGRFRQSQPSAASIERNQKSGESFDYVDTGIKKTILISESSQPDTISNIEVSKTFRSSVLLSWKYDGPVREVDHFQVFGSYEGYECLLGCSFLSLSFEDKILANRVGSVTYSVRPIFLNMVPGNRASITIKNEKSLPDILDSTFSQGKSWLPITYESERKKQAESDFEVRQSQNDLVVSPNSIKRKFVQRVPARSKGGPS